MLVGISICSVATAQVFDHLVNYPVNTGYPGTNYQLRVLSLSSGDFFYTLSSESPFVGGVITEFDQNGNVLSAHQVNATGGQPVFYSGMCLNAAEDELVLVGTTGSGTNREVLVTRYSITTNTVVNSVSVPSGVAGTWLEGVAIRQYPGGYLVGGNRKSCNFGCSEMLLIELNATLGVTWSGYFSNASVKDFIFRDMAVEQPSNLVTIMGFKDNIEVVFMKFNYNTNTLTVPLGWISNVKTFIYTEILETPPHLLMEPTAQGPIYYIGAGISDQFGRIHVLLTKIDINFSIVWSNAYVDGAGGPSAQIWSPGRLVLYDDDLVTSFQTANNSTPDNGILRVDKNNGLITSSISYNNWDFAALYPVGLNTGSSTMMTQEGYQFQRVFDGDQLANNTIGCGQFPRAIARGPAPANFDFYNLGDNSLGTPTYPNFQATQINDDYTHCSGAPIGTYKKAPTSIDAIEGQEGTASVYPNPTSNHFVLDVGDEPVSEIQIIDRLGKVVLQQTITKQQINIDMSAFDAGYYLIRLLGQEESNTIPLYKE